MLVFLYPGCEPFLWTCTVNAHSQSVSSFEFLSTGSFLFIYLFIYYLFIVMWHMGSYLVPPPGVEPPPSALEAQSLNHWTAREVPDGLVLVDEAQCINFFFYGYVFVFSLRNICPHQSCRDIHPELLRAVIVLVFMRGLCFVSNCLVCPGVIFLLSLPVFLAQCLEKLPFSH